jgi:predicted DCC family thiol-disulfide oxidoreductase YuxK
VLALPSQTPGVAEQYGVSRRQLDRELWAIDRNGRLFAGAAAVNRTLSELGEPWTSFALAYQRAPIRWTQKVVYSWIAKNRSRLGFFSTTPECEQPGTICE